MKYFSIPVQCRVVYLFLHYFITLRLIHNGMIILLVMAWRECYLVFNSKSEIISP